MANEQIIKDMLDAVLKATEARGKPVETAETRAAYARGIRAMASLVHVCANVAMDHAEEYKDHPVAGIMFEGYERALRMIVSAADEMIPEGYEP